MKRFAAACALACAFSITPRARADTPFAIFPKTLDGEPCSARAPGYFNGLGTSGRMWEAESNTSFDTNRVFTEHLDLAVAMPVRWISPLVTAVVRASAGVNTDALTGVYGIHGPILSFGVRDRSLDDTFWLEFGVRVLPNYPSPNDTNPATMRAALRSTLSSGIGDDAAWLPLSDFGSQIYALFQSRTKPWAMWYGTRLYFGAQYGGNASLAPLAVKTWLGPQTGFIGNAFLDVFFGVPVLWGKAANTQIGIHGDASLSSIWPGDQPFPFVANVFFAWSPKSWFQMRLFGGVAGAVSGPYDNQYGVRLALFAP